jgi:serine protease AprX
VTRPIAVRWLAALFCIASSVSASEKIAKDLLLTDSDEPIQVIVRYRSVPQAEHEERAARRQATIVKHLDGIRSSVYRIAPAQIEELAADPDVEYVSPDRLIHPSMDIAAPTVLADVAQKYGYTGAGVGVAVIDSGVSDPPDLSGRIVYRESLLSAKVDEQYGHGTHVAGAIAGSGKDSKGRYKGIAPSANIVAFRVLDDNGSGRDSDVIAAIDKAIALKTRYNIRVINLSLGRPVMESHTRDPLCQAVEKAWKSGIVVVVAAGNYGRDNSQSTGGYGTITSPGNDPYVITVGAMKNLGTPSRSDDQIATYSSKGPTLIDHVVKPDIVAPGNRVVGVSTKGDSVLEKSYPSNRVGSAYFVMSGTSMATPVVSGAVALLLQKEPGLTPDQVKARLMKSATKTFPQYSTTMDSLTGQVFTS